MCPQTGPFLRATSKLKFSLDYGLAFRPGVEAGIVGSVIHSDRPGFNTILYAEIEEAKLTNSGFQFVQLPFHPATLLSAVKTVMRSKGTAT
jgi:hypothetical protein